MNFLRKIKKHFFDIKQFGAKDFFRKLKILNFIILKNILVVFLVLPLILIFIIIRKFIVFRFGIIRSSRIGHFIANTELYLAERKFLTNNSKISFDFIALDSVGISNLYLKKHYEKKMILFPNIFIQPFYDFINFYKKKDLINKFNIDILGSGGDRDINGYLYKTDSSIDFTDHEDKKIIRDALEKLGLDVNSNFVCLNVRDDAYLKRTYPRGNWNYHNYRNWNIKKFIKASESLTKRGYKVLRMGKIVNDKLETSNPMIIDYANSPFKSDIMDIYLHTKCFFTATTGTGVDLASYVSRVPMAWISVPIHGFYSFKNHFHTTKHHKCKKTGRKLSLSEIFSYGDPTDQKFIEYVMLEELSETEIEEFLIEVLDHLENKKKFSKEDIKLNFEFWENYKMLVKQYKYDGLHKNYESFFSPSFLKKNPQFFK